MAHRLNIVSVETTPSHTFSNRREQIRLRNEALWEGSPEAFDPSGSALERLRLERTLELIAHAFSAHEKSILDLGCGSGAIARELRNRGGQVTALDVSKRALEIFKQIDSQEISLVHDCLPATLLEDGAFDLVLCLDVIAYLDPKDHRLLISEWARLVKNTGCIVCSTPLDIDSADALERFLALCETELEIIDWKCSYHRFFIRCLDFLQAPARFAQGRQNPEYRTTALNKRRTLAKYWFLLNTTFPLGAFWNLAAKVSQPLHDYVKNCLWLLNALEKICRPLKGGEGISHVILMAKRRSLLETPLSETDSIPRRKKQKIWE